MSVPQNVGMCLFESRALTGFAVPPNTIGPLINGIQHGLKSHSNILTF